MRPPGCCDRNLSGERVADDSSVALRWRGVHAKGPECDRGAGRCGVIASVAEPRVNSGAAERVLRRPCDRQTGTGGINEAIVRAERRDRVRRNTNVPAER